MMRRGSIELVKVDGGGVVGVVVLLCSVLLGRRRGEGK
jgi:hypothetical protein